MHLKVRKIVEQLVITETEQGQTLPVPHRVAIVAVVFENPYPEGYVQDLVTLANEVGPELGGLVGPRTVELLGGEVEAFGKCALVGHGGELEHGSALIHNLLFGNVFRDAAGGTELLPAAEKYASPGELVDIPLKHKLDSKTRSHHQTVSFQVHGAPRAREILVACAAATMGRPLQRLAPLGAETATAPA